MLSVKKNMVDRQMEKTDSKDMLSLLILLSYQIQLPLGQKLSKIQTKIYRCKYNMQTKIPLASGVELKQRK